MKQLGVFVMLVGLCACEKHTTTSKTEVKIEKKTDEATVPVEEKKTVGPAPDTEAGGAATNADAPLGFWKIDTIDGDDGKPVDLVKMFKGQWNGDGKLEYMRMSLKIESNKLTLANAMITGAKGDADYCSVSASTPIAIADKKFTIGDMAANAGTGSVKVDGTDTNTSNNNCNVTLGGGTYTMEVKGKNLVLHYVYEGKPSTMTLAPDPEEIDLKELTKAVANGKVVQP